MDNKTTNDQSNKKITALISKINHADQSADLIAKAGAATLIGEVVSLSIEVKDIKKLADEIFNGKSNNVVPLNTRIHKGVGNRDANNHAPEAE